MSRSTIFVLLFFVCSGFDFKKSFDQLIFSDEKLATFRLEEFKQLEIQFRFCRSEDENQAFPVNCIQFYSLASRILGPNLLGLEKTKIERKCQNRANQVESLSLIENLEKYLAGLPRCRKSLQERKKIVKYKSEED